MNKITRGKNVQKEEKRSPGLHSRNFNIEMLEWEGGAGSTGGKPREFCILEAKVFQEGGSGQLGYMPWEVTWDEIWESSHTFANLGATGDNFLGNFGRANERWRSRNSVHEHVFQGVSLWMKIKKCLSWRDPGRCCFFFLLFTFR